MSPVALSPGDSAGPGENAPGMPFSRICSNAGRSSNEWPHVEDILASVTEGFLDEILERIELPIRSFRSSRVSGGAFGGSNFARYEDQHVR